MKTIARIALVKQEPNDNSPQYREFIDNGGRFNAEGYGCVAEYDGVSTTTTELLRAVALIRVTADNLIPSLVLKLTDAELDALLASECGEQNGPLNLLKRSMIDRKNLNQ